jgi:hypothetical protein
MNWRISRWLRPGLCWRGRLAASVGAGLQRRREGRSRSRRGSACGRAALAQLVVYRARPLVAESVPIGSQTRFVFLHLLVACRENGRQYVEGDSTGVGLCRVISGSRPRDLCRSVPSRRARSSAPAVFARPCSWVPSGQVRASSVRSIGAMSWVTCARSIGSCWCLPPR